MSACRCDLCGKFRKEKDCVVQEEVSSDGFQLDQWIECRYCMAPVDAERYFKEGGE